MPRGNVMTYTLDEWLDAGKPLDSIICGDCLDVLPHIEDGSVDLVLTDPPYGIGASSKSFMNGTSKTKKEYYLDDGWDGEIPEKKVFDEMFRMSQNQIIWGGNYFIEYLKNARCFIIWDKTIHGNSYADCEFAWTSFDEVARIKVLNIVNVTMDGRVHPTQKPIALFHWILSKWSKVTDTIIDPFLGSGTTAVACKMLNRRYIGIEISMDYCKIAEKRLSKVVGGHTPKLDKFNQTKL
jgi:site-specific DNA-methyltransferase (adenine-specific)